MEPSSTTGEEISRAGRSSSKSEDLEAGQGSSQPQANKENPRGKKISYHRDLLRRPFKGVDKNDKFLNPYEVAFATLLYKARKKS